MPMERCVVKSFKKLSSQEEKCVCTFFFPTEKERVE